MPKRHLSLDRPLETERQIKASKLAVASESKAAAADPADPGSGTIAITVSLRSRSKAVQNDPKPESYWQQILQTLKDGSESPTAQLPAHSSSNTPSGMFPGLADDCEQNNRGKSVGDDEDRQDFNNSDTNDEEGQLYDDENESDSDDSDRSSIDEFAWFSWLEQIDAVATKRAKPIATCGAKLIRRNHISSAFWDFMEEPAEETNYLAFELFDRYGRLNRQYYEHSFKRGSGAWGRELDDGDILLFESLKVTLRKRRCGLGTQLVNAVLDKVRPKTNRFVALARPGYFIWGVGEEAKMEMVRQQRVSELFFRSLGFRRVGNSSWFAFVDDPDHPSRQLKASEDWDEPEASHNLACIPETARETFAMLSNAECGDDELVRQLQSSMPADTQDASWSAVDGNGNNLLHLAAINSKLEAVRYLLSCRPDLVSERNREGELPLEALKVKMESTRTRAQCGRRTLARSHRFEGFTQSSISCIAALSDSEIIDLDELSHEIIRLATEDHTNRNPKIDLVRHSLRLKYGCTCGECIGGFLSPRMRFALLCQAEIHHDFMMESFIEYQNGPDWVKENEMKLKFLPASVKENLKTNKSMREGFVSTCGHIAQCLRRNRIPNEDSVLYIHRYETSEWPPVMRNYLERGGTVAAVATILFKGAMEADKYSGDGDHQNVFEDEIGELPECRNDHEFGFVSGMCGYERVLTVGYASLAT